MNEYTMMLWSEIDKLREMNGRQARLIHDLQEAIHYLKEVVDVVATGHTTVAYCHPPEFMKDYVEPAYANEPKHTKLSVQEFAEIQKRKADGYLRSGSETYG